MHVRSLTDRVARGASARPGEEARDRCFRSFTAIRSRASSSWRSTFAATAVVEGGIDTWGVLYLRTRLATGVLVGAGAYAAGQLIAATTRASGANVIEPARAPTRVRPRVGTRGRRTGARGVVRQRRGCGVRPGDRCRRHLFVLAPHDGPVAPRPRSRRAPTDETAATTVLVGGFTAAGYMGWVLGPAVVGTLSDHEGSESRPLTAMWDSRPCKRCPSRHPDTVGGEIA